ncbi:hypothetical protein SAMN05428958_1212 [Pantoea sesami]|nr:hypothetical protein SAMN05428958_1212 [Pantoea sesami]
MDTRLTHSQFFTIYRKLALRSRTWADIWYMLHLTGMMAIRIIHLRHDDIRDGCIHFPVRGKFSACTVPLTPSLHSLIVRRRLHFPQDIWVFQSHSARVKGRPSPVTFIAFSQAIRQAARGVVSHSAGTRDALDLRPDDLVYTESKPPEPVNTSFFSSNAN